MTWDLREGDCRDVLATLDANSIDSCVTDPPYELGFMGKKWDSSGVAFDPKTWEAVYRVLKPGAHLVAFGGTRTYHRMACAIEDAGFEIRDSLHWLYGSGFPKSLNVSKAIDARLGAEREVLGHTANARPNRVGKATLLSGKQTIGGEITEPATDAGALWDGWGTALKPAHEPIILARKPLKGTVADNVLEYGTGAINVDACRIAGSGAGGSWGTGRRDGGFMDTGSENGEGQPNGHQHDLGRWPSNLLLCHSPACNGMCVPECPVAEMDRQSGITESQDVRGTRTGSSDRTKWRMSELTNVVKGIAGAGGASRFFPILDWEDGDFWPFRYVAKPARGERDAGLYSLTAATGGTATEREDGSAGLESPGAGAGRRGGARNLHPTVKPIALMSWLCKLVTRPGGLILDPFAGSGTTIIAATRAGFNAIGVELEYAALARLRIEEDSPLMSRPRSEGCGLPMVPR